MNTCDMTVFQISRLLLKSAALQTKCLSPNQCSPYIVVCQGCKHRNIRHYSQKPSSESSDNENPRSNVATSNPNSDLYQPIIEASAHNIEHGHGSHHDPLHGATHQVSHRVSEKVTFGVLERAWESLFRRVAKKAGTRASVKATERIGERAAAGAARRAAEHLGERVGERASEQIAGRTAERTAEKLIERASERATERAAERILERTAEKALPRAGERGALVAGERIAEHAVAAAAAHVAPRRLDRLAERVLLRVGRGITIALPALGSLFVLYLAREDRKRALTEMQNQNIGAARAFWLAFLCDASDAAAHVIIVLSLLHAQHGVGVHLPHDWLHMAEYGGLVVAAVGTVAAVMGEMLASGAKFKLPFVKFIKR